MAPPRSADASPVAAVLVLVAVAAAVEVLEPSGQSAMQPSYDVAAKQQKLNYKAQPQFYYRPMPATDTRTTATTSTRLSSQEGHGLGPGTASWRYGSGSSPYSGSSPTSDSSPYSGSSKYSSRSPYSSRDAPVSGTLSSRQSSAAGGYSSAPYGGSSSSTRYPSFSSGLSGASSSGGGKLSGSSDFPSSSSLSSASSSSRDAFSSGLSSSSSSGRLSSSSSASFTRGLSSSSGDFPSSPKSTSRPDSSSSSDFLSGFLPSTSAFGSSPFRSSSPFIDDPEPSFPRTPSSTLTLFATSFRDDDEPGLGGAVGGFFGGGGGSAEDASEAPDTEGEQADAGGRYERDYLHTRDFRDTKAVGGPGSSSATLRPRSSRFKRKQRQSRQRVDAGKPGKAGSAMRHYGEHQYRLPYVDTRDNNTDYKYYEDHNGNDTHREHHYRHVITTHNYYNATNATTTAPYSRDAAYDALRAVKKLNYNADHVYKDGRYIPIVHKVGANLSEGDFPDGPHVKHHYYHNEYSHDHRNKSEGPTVRHHYHNKDVKVFYHDHRNKTGGAASSPYSKYSTYSPDKYSTYTPGKYSGYSTGSYSYNTDKYATYSPDKYSTYSPSKHSSTNSPEAGGEQESSSEGSSEKPLVKHHHHFKEYHYDAKGNRIDPRRYNYTDTYPSNYTTVSADEAEAAAESEEGDEPRGGHSEQSGHQDEDDGPASTRSYYYNSNHANHYGADLDSARRPLTSKYESEPEFTTSSPVSYRRPSAFHRPSAAVGYQLHYRDYGDHAFASKEVNFEDGFSFHKERRAGPTSYLETYTTPGGGSGYFSTFRANPDADDHPRYRGLSSGHGYRSGLVTRDVDGISAAPAGPGAKRAAVGVPSGPPPPHPSALVGLGHGLGHGAARAFPDHTRSLVSRGNIGYILVDPLGELPTIRIHASLVNSPGQTAQSVPYPRYLPAPSLPPGLAPATPARGFLFTAPDPFHSSTTALRRVDATQSPAPPSSSPSSSTSTTTAASRAS